MKFKKYLIYLIITVFTLGIGLTITQQLSAKPGVKWLDLDAGMKKAQKEKKPVLIDFYADWCFWCKKMEEDVFHNKEIAKKLKNEYITVRIDTESTKNITYKGKIYSPKQITALFGVSGLPTIIFMDKKTKPITKIPSYIKPAVFKPLLDYIKDECYLTKITFDNYLKNNKKCK